MIGIARYIWYARAVDDSEGLLLPAALRNRTSFVLIRLAALARQRCAGQLAAVGLSQHQHAILCCLDEYGRACQKDIAARLGIDGGDVVAFVDGLQQAGLITRERDERDRRRQILGLTASGRQLLGRVEGLMDAAEPGALGPLTDEQRALLHASATEVLAADAPQSWVPGERLAGAERPAGVTP
jgi:MarR family transcriptional regulator, lower aerobic nicotinate degradation pathway regulator